MKKDERLLDLIALLLNSREPISFEEIQHAFPEDYGEGSEEAIARKFERDKADILKLGLPLKFVAGDEFDKAGYIIERSSYVLPRLELGPEELALLFLAGTAALQLEGTPFERDLVLALNKIGFAAGIGDQQVRTPRSLPTTRNHPAEGLRQREHLEMLRRAIGERKTITLTYHGLWQDKVTQRRVDPYGLAYRRGTWILVGRCHLRQAIRVFHVNRIRGLAVNPLRPSSPDFEFPVDFELRSHVADAPWRIQVHEPVAVVLRVGPPIAETLLNELQSLVDKVEEDGDDRVLHLTATFLDAMLPMVLWYRGRVQVLKPPELVRKVGEAFGRLTGEAGR